MDIEEAFAHLNDAVDVAWAITFSHSLYSDTSGRKLTITISSHAAPYPNVEITMYVYPDRSAYRLDFRDASRQSKDKTMSVSRGLCYDVTGKYFYIMRMDDDDRYRLSRILTKLEDKMDTSIPEEAWDFL